KAAAGLSNSDLTVEEHQQGAGLDKPGIPFLAVPSTAGTGSEATIVSVLIDPERQLKKSVRHPSYMAKLVILDAGLLASCPPHIIAGAGMDAFVQAIESYSSRSATWLSKQLSAKSICLLHSSLGKVHQNSADPAATDLMLGSYLAGLALSMARLGVIHGLVHPLGVRYGLPHGLLCGITLPAALKLNRQAMGAAYSEISELIGDDLLKTAKNLLLALGLEKSPLAGKEISDRENIITETLSSGSTKTNPKKINRQDVEFLLSELTGS
ncbi:MAG: iron-containing alcohol dehydrogenase, partial [Lentisphaeria bacterium]